MKTGMTAFLLAATLATVGCSSLTAVVRDENPIAIGAMRPAPPPAPPEPTVAAPAPRVRVERSRIAVDEKIHFNTGSADIAAQSNELLNEIARVLRENPRVTKIRIEGHTDNVGAAAFNRRLSQQRADAVRQYLVGQGIDGGRMVAQGFGPDHPIGPNDTEEGKSNNRRVEFNIVEQTDAAAGGAQ